MTEKEVLAILDIEDFRHLTKEKVISFASLLTEMDPCVAEKALDQFPDFAKTIAELAADFKEVFVECVADNSATTRACLATCQTIIDTLSAQLQDGVETYEERRFYIETMRDLANQMQSINTENKNFLWKVIATAGITIVLLGGVVLTALGGNTRIPLPTKLTAR